MSLLYYVLSDCVVYVETIVYPRVASLTNIAHMGRVYGAVSDAFLNVSFIHGGCTSTDHELDPGSSYRVADQPVYATRSASAIEPNFSVNYAFHESAKPAKIQITSSAPTAM